MVIRSLAVVFLVVAVSAIVALGATDFGLLLPAGAGRPGLPWFARAVGAIAVIAGLVALVRQRRRYPPRGDRAPDPTASALGAAATIMCILAVIAMLSPRMQVEQITEQATRQSSTADSASGEAGSNAALLPQAAEPGGVGRGSSPRGRVGARRPAQNRANAPGGGSPSGDVLAELGDRLMLILLFVVAAIAFIALTGRFGRRNVPPPIGGQTLAADEAEAVLQASLGEFDYTGDDPRRRITAAYHRLLMALAEAGAPREPQEAPYEYLNRVLGPVGVRSQSMHELTELYVIAQFSELPITTEHRLRAIAALEGALSDLRTTGAESFA